MIAVILACGLALFCVGWALVRHTSLVASLLHRLLALSSELGLLSKFKLLVGHYQVVLARAPPEPSLDDHGP